MLELIQMEPGVQSTHGSIIFYQFVDSRVYFAESRDKSMFVDTIAKLTGELVEQSHIAEAVPFWRAQSCV